MWDFNKLSEELNLEDVNVSHNPDLKTCTESYLLRTFGTKNSSIMALHFTRRNLMYAIGRYDPS